VTGLYGGSLTYNAGVWSGTFGSSTLVFTESNGDLEILVPEPATATLALAAAGLMLRRRR
jgi:uncharacterized protein (TIGR03382 family)